VIWQRFLPYHRARLGRLAQRAEAAGHRLTGLEAASQDVAYGFPEGPAGKRFELSCAFPGAVYHELTAGQVHRRIREELDRLDPDVVFAPATPFPEGMAAIAWRNRQGRRTVLMDDAWELTDRRGSATRLIKRLLHRNVDAALVPALSHRDYYVRLGFPPERIFFGVDTVDNDAFAAWADSARREAPSWRLALGLPEHYFLAVARFLPRKGLETLLEAYGRFRAHPAAPPWGLVLVGDGPLREHLVQAASYLPGVVFAGRRFGEELGAYYGLAGALVVPSDSDPWALVVNEGAASGVPLLVSRGCGAAEVLVRESENGWTFQAGNTDALLERMLRTTLVEPVVQARMGRRSREIVAGWSLDRFADGALAAASVMHRPTAGLASRALLAIWRGHVRTT